MECDIVVKMPPIKSYEVKIKIGSVTKGICPIVDYHGEFEDPILEAKKTRAYSKIVGHVKRI